MAIYLKCCNKEYQITKRKCELCNKTLIKFVVKVQDPATRKWKTKTISNLKLAKETEIKFKTDLMEGNLFISKKIVGIDFEKYLEHAKFHKKNWKSDLSMWNCHIKNNDYHSKSGIVKILSDMKQNGSADGTIHQVLKLIRYLYNWSIENEYFYDKNPCDSIKAPKYDNRVTDYLKIDEVVKLVNDVKQLENFRAANIILFALYTGRRKSEITNLEWKNVHFDNRTITCKETKNGKTLSFPLNDKAYNILMESYKQKISNLVFPSSTGHNYYSGFNSVWLRLKKRINLNYRFHDLRHTYASHLASSGKVDIYTLKNLLGHQDIALTMR